MRLGPIMPTGSDYGVTYLGKLTWSSGSTITGTINIGPADSTKEVFLIGAVTGGTRSLVAATTKVDGVAVTKATTEISSTSTLSAAFVGLPTNAGNVTVTATYDGTLSGGVIGVFQVLRRTHRGNNQTDADGDFVSGGTSTVTNSTTIGANGIWFGAHVHGNTNATTSPATEDIDDAGSSSRFVVCHRDVQTTGSTPVDTWSWSGSTSAFSQSWAFN